METQNPNTNNAWGVTPNPCHKCKQANNTNPLGNYCMPCIKVRT